jgi:hypothetical protein
MIDKNSRAYSEGFNAESARIRVRDAARAALDAHPNLPDLAGEVARQLGRDQGHKQRIVQRSPHIFASMDASELGQASSRELAARELKELGIEVGDGDPVQLLDMHHAGRQFARGNNGNKLMGSASDAADTPAFLSKYLEEG